MFITSKNKYLSNDMKIFGTCSIPLMEMYTQRNTFVSDPVSYSQSFYKKWHTLYIPDDLLSLVSYAYIELLLN